MIELRKALNAQLKTVHPRVYFQQAPELAPFPYLVFDFPSIYDDGEGQEFAIVDVDAWDVNPDTTSLETLISSVNSALNKSTLTSGNITAAFYLDTKIPLTDDDPLIRRRKYIYQARIFRRG